MEALKNKIINLSKAVDDEASIDPPKVEIIKYIDTSDEGMSGAATAAIVLVVLLLIVTIMCIIFCRCVKKETDDHFRRLKTVAIDESRKKKEKAIKNRSIITIRKN